MNWRTRKWQPPPSVSLDEAIADAWRQPRYEPHKRKCGGVDGWVAHRFPIKGGISARDVMAAQLGEPNALLKRLLRRRRRK